MEVKGFRQTLPLAALCSAPLARTEIRPLSTPQSHGRSYPTGDGVAGLGQLIARRAEDGALSLGGAVRCSVPCHVAERAAV